MNSSSTVNRALQLSGTGTALVVGQVTGGSASLTVGPGASVVSAGSTSLSTGANSTAGILVTGAARPGPPARSTPTSGLGSTATIKVANGGTINAVATRPIITGVTATAVASLTVTGSGSTFNASGGALAFNSYSSLSSNSNGGSTTTVLVTDHGLLSASRTLLANYGSPNSTLNLTVNQGGRLTTGTTGTTGSWELGSARNTTANIFIDGGTASCAGIIDLGDTLFSDASGSHCNLSILNGGSVTATNAVNVGLNSGFNATTSTGTVTGTVQVDGAGSSLVAGTGSVYYTMWLGASAGTTGTLNVSNGAAVTVPEFYAGHADAVPGFPVTGSITVSGSGSTLTANSNGITNPLANYVGYGAGSTASLNFANNSVGTLSALNVGYGNGSTGTVSITSNSAVTANGLALGAGTSTYVSTATVVLDASTLSITGTGSVTVGTAGSNAGLTVQDGATLNVANAILIGSLGTVVETGGTITAQLLSETTSTSTGILNLSGGTLNLGLGTAAATGTVGAQLIGSGGQIIISNPNLVEDFVNPNGTFSGPINLVTGEIRVSANSALGSSGILTLGGTATTNATLTLRPNVSLSRPVVVDGTTPGASATIGVSSGTGMLAGSLTLNKTVTFNPVGALVVSGMISGTGGVVQAGGLTTLSGSNSYSGGTTVNAGLLVAQSGQSSLGSGAVVINGGVTSGGNLILENTSAGTAFSALQQGYNRGGWNGAGGINSASAATDPTHLHAVGMLQPSSAGTFQGQPLGTGDVAIKYTWYGDANLDGTVDGSDYSLIDAGYASNRRGFVGTVLTGWYNGDFNYDRMIDGSDYSLIDNAFNNQGATIAAIVATSTAQVAGPSAPVPEPAILSLFGIGAAGLLGRCRRHR